ncbi:MAG: TetR/AcrR family transcriptional regulator [Kofleriaceae bacterium]|nr:TetR/AcrR family transcriptional regulator [Kofleriaceae bacterium]MCL4225833.1 TetR/AcrR family transcriptional regulator [Myxococcales bacterium]
MARTVDTQRRTELARQALEVMRARGIGRTTMSELAQALGVKRPTLYFYFRDLTGLLHAALADVYRDYFAHVQARVRDVEHPVEALGELARATVEFNRGRRDLVVLLFQLWAAGDADPLELLDRARAVGDPMRAELVSRLRAGIERKVVARCDPERVVDLVLTVLDGTLVQEVTRGASGAPVVDELWDRVLAPLVLERPPPKRRARA